MAVANHSHPDITESRPLVYPALPPGESAINGNVLQPGNNTALCTKTSDEPQSHNLQTNQSDKCASGANGSAVPFLASDKGEAGVMGVGEKEDSGEERQTWDKKVDFVLAIVGFAIDLGNVWRFPYICYKNGGGAFLIPYLLMLAFLGLPLFYMELSLGQFHRKGPITIWKHICPMFCGIGYGICFVATFVGSYYNTIIAWALYYMVMSFRATLPYATCNNSWNTEHCVSADHANRTNMSMSSAEEFFEYHVLESHKANGIEEIGAIRWQLLLCLMAIYIIVFFCCWKGTKSTGKAVWVTATMPFVVLTVLLVRGVTLPGAGNGVLYYLRPDFTRLTKVEVWVDAAAQIFFSLGPGFGALLALSSYNTFHNNCFKDAVLTSCINCGTSFVAGLVVFSFLGYMADRQNTTVDSVATQGPGLVFVVYAEAISTLAGSTFWAIIFFFMLITLGLDSTFGGLEAVMTGIADEFVFFKSRRSLLVALTCGYCFLLGLPSVTYGGKYFVYLVDIHAAPISLIFICLTEVIAVNWFYGVKRFAADIQCMLGFRPNYFWMVCWTVINPVALLVLFILSLVGYEHLTLDQYVFPPWAEAVGWMMTALSIICIPLYLLALCLSTSGTLAQKWHKMVTPLLHQRGLSQALAATEEKNGQVRVAMDTGLPNT